jgi:hypothetical protein
LAVAEDTGGDQQLPGEGVLLAHNKQVLSLAEKGLPPECDALVVLHSHWTSPARHASRDSSATARCICQTLTVAAIAWGGHRCQAAVRHLHPCHSL